MNTTITNSENYSQLISQLGDSSAVVRETSRKQLVHRGGDPVLQALITVLRDPRKQVRWEAAKALQEIADPKAADALVQALTDEDFDVRWVASEALIALNHNGAKAVLSGLIHRAGFVAYRKSAHHILAALKYTSVLLVPVLKTLERSDSALSTPVAAYQAMLALSEFSTFVGWQCSIHGSLISSAAKR